MQLVIVKVALKVIVSGQNLYEMMVKMTTMMEESMSAMVDEMGVETWHDLNLLLSCFFHHFNKLSSYDLSQSFLQEHQDTCKRQEEMLREKFQSDPVSKQRIRDYIENNSPHIYESFFAIMMKNSSIFEDIFNQENLIKYFNKLTNENSEEDKESSWDEPDALAIQ